MPRLWQMILKNNYLDFKTTKEVTEMCGGDGMNAFWYARGIPVSARAVQRKKEIHWVCPKCGEHNLLGCLFCVNCDRGKRDESVVTLEK